MKISLPNVFYIIITASFIGLILNFIRPDGISLMREAKSLVWADSTNFNKKTTNDSVKNESSADNTIISIQDSVINSKKDITLKDKIEDSGKTQEKIEVKPFKKPVAINLKQAYTLFRENITFLDARENEDYKAGHIKGALSLPYYDFDSYKNILDRIPKNKIIVTYCAGTDCDLSILLGEQLFELGYKRIYIFFDGWNEWVKAKYPVDQ